MNMGVRFKKFYTIGGLVLLVLLLAANLYSSQAMPPLYYRLVDGERAAIPQYLTQIRQLSVFQSELLRYKNTYGLWVENQVFKKEWERNEMIARLEAALQKNPQSRDVLYGLSVLYADRGDSGRAQAYLERARQIDPALK